jgi:hypothetical protein
MQPEAEGMPKYNPGKFAGIELAQTIATLIHVLPGYLGSNHEPALQDSESQNLECKRAKAVQLEGAVAWNY